jgi:hypothetical protein
MRRIYVYFLCLIVPAGVTHPPHTRVGGDFRRGSCAITRSHLCAPSLLEELANYSRRGRHFGEHLGQSIAYARG